MIDEKGKRDCTYLPPRHSNSVVRSLERRRNVVELLQDCSVCNKVPH
jgi:hypothetical protein